MANCSAMPAPEAGALDRVRPDSSGVAGRVGVEAPDRRIAAGAPVRRGQNAEQDAQAGGAFRRAPRISTLMKRIGIHTLYRKPHTSPWHPAHPVYPYQVRHLTITRPHHVWAADLTYIPMPRGFVYLLAAIDWASRRVLSWRLSNTLTTDFCIEAVQEARRKYGKPESSTPTRAASSLAWNSRAATFSPTFHNF
jgi:transposase InsO family protein